MGRSVKPISQPNPGEHTLNPLPRAPPPPSAAQQDDDVDEQQADEDEGEVDEELLQVPPGLRVHLDLGRPADGRLGHVLDALHGDSGPLEGERGVRERERWVGAGWFQEGGTEVSSDQPGPDVVVRSRVSS